MYRELKLITDKIEKHIIINESIYKSVKKDENLKEILKLYIKQHNLVKTILLLLENKRSEEVYILSRTLLNVTYLINYLFDDDNDRSHFKKYINQTKIDLMNTKKVEQEATKIFKKYVDIDSFEIIKNKNLNKKNIYQFQNFLK